MMTAKRGGGQKNIGRGKGHTFGGGQAQIARKKIGKEMEWTECCFRIF